MLVELRRRYVSHPRDHIRYASTYRLGAVERRTGYPLQQVLPHAVWSVCVGGGVPGTCALEVRATDEQGSAWNIRRTTTLEGLRAEVVPRGCKKKALVSDRGGQEGIC